MTRLLLLLPLALLLGCPVTGDNFPQQYANTYCSAAYLCVEDPDDIEAWTGWDDEDDCVESLQSDMESSSLYDQYEEGDRDFDKDAADRCLEEIDEVRDDADCGEMGFVEFTFDAEANFCPEAYPEFEE